jgi:hypothetical protein
METREFPWDEYGKYLQGNLSGSYYDEMLEEAATADERNADRPKVIKSSQMPWENSPHGLLKHIVNEGMNTRAETVDAYMQVIPPGSRSGKHRQLAEQAFYVIEGSGYDIHVDCDLAIVDDNYTWQPDGKALRVGSRRRRLRSAEHDQPALQRQRVQAGAHCRDHQPHLSQERAQRSRATRDRARIRPGRKADG